MVTKIRMDDKDLKQKVLALLDEGQQVCVFSHGSSGSEYYCGLRRSQGKLFTRVYGFDELKEIASVDDWVDLAINYVAQFAAHNRYPVGENDKFCRNSNFETVNVIKSCGKQRRGFFEDFPA